MKALDLGIKKLNTLLLYNCKYPDTTEDKLIIQKNCQNFDILNKFI